MINFRKGANPGEWCCLLVPLALWVSGSSSPICLLLSPFLAVSSLVWARRWLYPDSTFRGFILELVSSPFLCLDDIQARSSEVTLNVALSLCLGAIALLLGGVFEALLGTIGCCVFDLVLQKTLTTFPGSFTFGEACLASQAVVLYMVQSTSLLLSGGDDVTTVEGSLSTFTRICLLSVIGMLTFPVSCLKTSTYFLAYGLAFFCSVTHPLLWLCLKRNPATWLFYHVVSQQSLLILLSGWVVLVFLAFLVVDQRVTPATTRFRKVFHLLVVLVFVTGVGVDMPFASMASQLVLGIFLVLEFIRAFRIQPVGGMLHRAFRLFLDEKDRGFLVLTHIYLLVGTFLPLWLTPLTNSYSIQLFSGILSIGIGDSAASIVGSTIGRLHWPSSRKTLEGTLASIVAQWAYVYYFINLNLNLHRVLPVIAVGSVIEALTNQVDNVVLPLTLYIMLSLIQ